MRFVSGTYGASRSDEVIELFISRSPAAWERSTSLIETMPMTWSGSSS